MSRRLIALLFCCLTFVVSSVAIAGCGTATKDLQITHLRDPYRRIQDNNKTVEEFNRQSLSNLLSNDPTQSATDAATAYANCIIALKEYSLVAKNLTDKELRDAGLAPNSELACTQPLGGSSSSASPTSKASATPR